MFWDRESGLSCVLMHLLTTLSILPSITTIGQAIGIPVVTATQTLSSMQTNDLPTRAEVDELYFLISRGTDCIMGSEEFAVGMYPEAVGHIWLHYNIH